MPRRKRHSGMDHAVVVKVNPTITLYAWERGDVLANLFTSDPGLSAHSDWRARRAGSALAFSSRDLGHPVPNRTIEAQGVDKGPRTSAARLSAAAMPSTTGSGPAGFSAAEDPVLLEELSSFKLAGSAPSVTQEASVTDPHDCRCWRAAHRATSHTETKIQLEIVKYLRPPCFEGGKASPRLHLNTNPGSWDSSARVDQFGLICARVGAETPPWLAPNDLAVNSN